MDFTEFVKRVYEMDELFYLLRETDGPIIHTIWDTNIGRVEDHVDKVEIALENNDVIYVHKDRVADILYNDSSIVVKRNDGLEYVFEDMQ